MQRLAAADTLQIDPEDGGTEVFVVDGTLAAGDRGYPAEAWLRFPMGDSAVLEAVVPTLVWVKTGHLFNDQ